MRNRTIGFAVIAVLVAGLTGFAVTDKTSKVNNKAAAKKLLAALPASDAVVFFDSKRFLVQALPQIMTGNQPMLTDVMNKIGEIETATGIDLRQFDKVAAGVAYKKVSATETDYEPVIIATGSMTPAAVTSAVERAAKGDVRTEKFGSHTLYIFSVKQVPIKPETVKANSTISGLIDKAAKSLSKEIAVTTLDNETIAIGPLTRVREAITTKGKVSADLSSLIAGKENAVMSFAMRTPPALSSLLPVDDDQLGKDISSIKYLSGSLDVIARGAALQMTARTEKAEQARALKETLGGLQFVGSSILGQSKRDDQRAYARILASANIVSRANDVSIDLVVSQSDIDLLIAQVK